MRKPKITVEYLGVEYFINWEKEKLIGVKDKKDYIDFSDIPENVLSNIRYCISIQKDEE